MASEEPNSETLLKLFLHISNLADEARGMIGTIESLYGVETFVFGHEVYPEKLDRAVVDCATKMKSIEVLMASKRLNYELSLKLSMKDDSENYELKKELVKSTNAAIRDCGGVILNKEAPYDMMLIAIASPDGFGRYVLEDKETKKRSNSSKSLRELLPLRLGIARPRKEGFLKKPLHQMLEDMLDQESKPDRERKKRRKKKPEA